MAFYEETYSLFSGTLPVSVARAGAGPAYLILHGGAGPGSVAGLAERLAQVGQVVVPTLPGFAGRPRPEWFRRIDDLALALLALVERLELNQVVVVGNSLGGWVGAELALRKSPNIAGLVLLNAVGIDPGLGVPPVVDPTMVPPADRAALSFHDPRKGFGPPTEAQQASFAEGQKALRVYSGGPEMADPTLRDRLTNLDLPSLVVWGESDRIVTLDYGRAWATSLPGGRLVTVAEAGHFPQIEQPEIVTALIREFADGLRTTAGA